MVAEDDNLVLDQTGNSRIDVPHGSNLFKDLVVHVDGVFAGSSEVWNIETAGPLRDVISIVFKAAQERQSVLVGERQRGHADEVEVVRVTRQSGCVLVALSAHHMSLT